jgi:hypothetical protein
MSGTTAREIRDRQALVNALAEIGLKRGVIVSMAWAGQILERRCEATKCFCKDGREHFPMPPVDRSPWGPTIDHSPILKSNGGKRDAWNVRLAHKHCNNEDFAWRARINRMIKRGDSLTTMAESLNEAGVATPHGSKKRWTPVDVRRAFVA